MKRVAIWGGIAVLGLGLGAATLSPAATTLKDEQRALIKAKQDALIAHQRSRQFEHDAAAERDEAVRAKRLAAAVAARIQEAEAGIAAAEARIAIVARFQAAQRARLAEKQGAIVRLVAALQTMSRRPPVLAIVQPGSTRDVVHVRSLLATVMPVVEERTAGLRDEVARGRALRRTADHAAAALREGRQKLQAERVALARLEAEHRARSQRYANSAMFESDRALALGEEARDITDLMDELEVAAVTREALESLPGPLLRPRAINGAAHAPVDRRPAATRNPPYRLPVVGEVVTGLGEVSVAGTRSRGITLQTAPDAQVVAPTSGRIAFAAPWRGYGQIVIIDHGGGVTTLITGMTRLGVKVGDNVEQGSPLGRAGQGRPTITVELRRDGQPVDIVPLVS
ncbi:murein hydrolase activator EnvC [Sphingomonas sp. LaA6.9]|uniref:murein hydrolase activator EnvC family protein n=1 Tax=Sphingomonas sp. LaA6.9 TaxID=2919914 RepID=UPI001F4F337F|nr:peptidoglycan DD-metalloendopeptidase family protein [Sphingomonas sp. LaA6.9]MCJ8156831.1 peptidoglycan DD-metalloendopeptidase family protein [Sphingomonas sp. LaA6.9]